MGVRIVARGTEGAALQREDDPQGRIDMAEFVEGQMPDGFAKTGGVNSGGLLDQDPGQHSVADDLGAETGGSCRCRGWGNQQSRQRQ
jgi:hypothetical protein